MEHFIGSPAASFTDLLLDAVCVVDARGRFVFVSAACEQIFGYTQTEMIGMTMIELVAPHDRVRTLSAATSVMGGTPFPHFENQYVRKDGSLVDILWSARWSEQDQVRVAIARDITVMKRTEAMQAALYAISEAAHAADDLDTLFARSHAIIGKLLPIASFSVALHGDHGCTLHCDFQAADSAPHDPLLHAELVSLLCEHVTRQKAPLLLQHPAPAGLAPALRAAVDGMPGSALAVPLCDQERTIGVLVLRSSLIGARYTHRDRDLVAFVSTQLAASIGRKQLHAQMRFMAMHDELTRLPNRRLFHDRLATSLARAQRQQSRLALLFIDLNRFKQVNDQHGHACGDRLLQETARRIKACLREADTLARIGGDEFVVLLESILLPHDAALVADKIHLALAAPVELGNGLRIPITVSVGLALYPEHGADTKALLAHADQAMYAAKAALAIS
ncbi:sensor domain-containing protein [Massilia sp. S19_KUP03_FR1]|uniref:sensor domain-containing protein n=1 Tax=Massilia sp. S19_KUP03_FR1 TaxID=3025503 RepID=UPI002FCD8234